MAHLTWALLLAFLCSAQAAKQAPIVFIIQSQEGSYHQDIAFKTKASILKQWTKFVPGHVMDPPRVILTTEMEDGLSYSAWTIFPLISTLREEMVSEPDLDWVAILNENTEIDLRNLNEAVQTYAYKAKEEALFLGRGLKDESSTIIHHFDSFESTGVVYPDLEAGIFLSRKLILDLGEELEFSIDEKPMNFPSDFNIDASYEFAKFLLKGGPDKGVKLTHHDEICAKKNSNPKCLSYPRQMNGCLKTSEKEGFRDILTPPRSRVMVKTCSKFHDSRLGVVRQTFGKHLPLTYVSDLETGPPLNTIKLPYTVNTEAGHCNKTMAIIQHFLQEESEAAGEFLVIVDDDTILSAARLGSLLACYQQEDQPLLLGQRYGYGVAGSPHGYSYITGGGGMLVNRPGAELLAKCACPQASTPDDMHLGLCARRQGVRVLHSARMFQARPPDYSSSLLAYRKPVSFHKHWEIDPFKVYEDYFAKADSNLEELRDEL